jgi:limonene-1,2-epoxide hydrolase
MDPLTWVNIGIGVAQGIESAIAVFNKLRNGQTTTEAELQQAIADTKDLHNQVQTA